MPASKILASYVQNILDVFMQRSGDCFKSNKATVTSMDLIEYDNHSIVLYIILHLSLLNKGFNMLMMKGSYIMYQMMQYLKWWMKRGI